MDNLSLTDHSIATNDTIIAQPEAEFPLWDLVYAHQLDITATGAAPRTTTTTRKTSRRKKAATRTTPPKTNQS